MLDVHRLRLLRELDRRGTLVAVARALSYSPSAISQQLSQLETEMGVTLLEPAGRGVRLTPQARILVGHTEAILERLERAEADVRASLAEVRGTLRVASFQSVLLALVPSVLTRLAREHQGLRVEIAHQEAGPAFAGLLAHDFDVVLGEEYPGIARPPVPGTRTQLLANDELYVVFPFSRPRAADGEPDGQSQLADLASTPWIFDPADTAPGQWARNACREAGFEPDVRYVASDLLLQIHLAETGHAAAVIPGLLLSAVPRPAARIMALPGRPHRRLTTGIRQAPPGIPRSAPSVPRCARRSATPLPPPARRHPRPLAKGRGATGSGGDRVGPRRAPQPLPERSPWRPGLDAAAAAAPGDGDPQDRGGVSGDQGARTLTEPLRTDTSSMSTTMPGLVTNVMLPLRTSASTCRSWPGR